MVRKIPIKNRPDIFTLVDDEDYEFAIKKDWSIRGGYARCGDYKLEKFLLGKIPKKIKCVIVIYTHSAFNPCRKKQGSFFASIAPASNRSSCSRVGIAG